MFYMVYIYIYLDKKQNPIKKPFMWNIENVRFNEVHDFLFYFYFLCFGSTPLTP